jgi:hypothetical protein
VHLLYLPWMLENGVAPCPSRYWYTEPDQETIKERLERVGHDHVESQLPTGNDPQDLIARHHRIEVYNVAARTSLGERSIGHRLTNSSSFLDWTETPTQAGFQFLCSLAMHY